MQEDKQPLLVNPNVADVVEISQIPGVGKALAERIVEARPFQDLDELQQVSGIGEKFLARIRPYLTLNHVEGGAVKIEETEEPMVSAEKASVEAAEEPLSAVADVEGEEEMAIEEESEEEEEAPPESEVVEKTEPKYITMRQATGLAFASGLIALILALVLSLGILAGINNGGLQFVSPVEFGALKSQVKAVSEQVGTVEGSLSGLRERVDNLEALSPRVEAVEQAQQDLSEAVDDAVSQVEVLNTQLEEINGTVESLQEQNMRTMEFFNGLQELLASLFQGEGE